MPYESESWTYKARDTNVNIIGQLTRLFKNGFTYTRLDRVERKHTRGELEMKPVQNTTDEHRNGVNSLDRIKV